MADLSWLERILLEAGLPAGRAPGDILRVAPSGALEFEAGIEIPSGVAGKLVALDGVGGLAASALPVPPTANGTYKLQVVSGVYSWLNDAFDPATLPLELWLRGSYTAPGSDPRWTGTSSAGGSGSRNLTEATNYPAAGSALNSFTPADFDGSNDKLANSTAITSLISLTAGSAVCLFYADTAFTDLGASQYYQNPSFLVNATDGYFGFGFSTSGVRLGSYDASNGFNSIAVACGTGAWHLAQARWNSTTMEVRVDSGAWSTFSKQIQTSANGIYVGTSYAAAGGYFDGKIMELMSAQQRFTDDQFNNIKLYVNTRYGLSL